MRYHKSESGNVIAICENCDRWYNLSNEWDVANLDWHECEKVGA